MNIEFRYINIRWLSKGVPIRIEKSEHVFKLEQDHTGSFVDVQAFKRLHGTVGVRVVKEGLVHTPYFELGPGSTSPLLPVKDPETDETWWIDNGAWDEQNKRVLSEIYRTVGESKLKVQGETVRLKVSTVSLSEHELNTLLEDFKDGLWGLIVNDSSPVKGNVEKASGTNIFNDELVHDISEFSRAVDGILRRPKIEIKQTEIEAPVHSARPISSSFRAIASRGYARNIPAKGYVESYDNPENQFVFYGVKRLKYLVETALHFASVQDKLYGDMAENAQQVIGRLKSKETKVIDKDVFDNELETLRQMVDDFEERKKLVPDSSRFASRNSEKWDVGTVSSRKITLKLSKPFGNLGYQFFINELNGLDAKKIVEEDFKKTNANHFKEIQKQPYAVVSFPDALSELISKYKIFGRQAEILIDCDFNVQRLKKSNRLDVNIFEIRSIDFYNINFLKSYEEKIQRRIYHEKNAWTQPISSDDKKEIYSEVAIVERKLNRLSSVRKQFNKFIGPVNIVNKNLRSQRDFFNEKRVKSRTQLPNSLVFINNPHYYNFRLYYRRIMAGFNMDEGIMEDLISLQSKGIMQISYIYEKWCLLQIIKILVEVYQFSVVGDWKKAMLNFLGPDFGRSEFSLEFWSPRKDKKLVLDYEKKNSAGKIPDFKISLQPTEEYSGKDSKTEAVNELVLDAKFRDDLNENGINRIIENISEEKDYSNSGQTPVFILHPSASGVLSRTSPLTWGRSCNYGQLSNHRSGSIYMMPSGNNLKSVDNLQRLIGYFFQRNFNIRYDADSRKFVYCDAFCVSCGEFSEDKFKVARSTTGGGFDKFDLFCKSCKVRSTLTHCFSCSSPIFKNGFYWTCHRTRSEQVSNVICPKCQEFF